MSIDATIEGVQLRANGDVVLILGGDCPGQPMLYVLNPPAYKDRLFDLIDKDIWGSSDTIMLGTEKFANRIGYCEIEIVHLSWRD